MTVPPEIKSKAIAKFGPTPDTWAEFVSARDQQAEKQRTLSPEDFELWQDWLQAGQEKADPVQRYHGAS